MVGYQVTNIFRFIIEPFPRGYNDFALILVQPSTPPTKRAICCDVVFTVAHKYQFLIVFNSVVAHKHCRCSSTYVFFCPCNIIRENETFANRYTLRNRVGKGSFGQVVAAHDNIANIEVAIKIINSDNGIPSSFVSSFED